MSVFDKIAGLEVQVPVRDPNTFTSREYAEHFGVGIDTAQRRLEKIAKQGTIVRCTVPILRSGNHIYPAPGWRYVTPSTNTPPQVTPDDRRRSRSKKVEKFMAKSFGSGDLGGKGGAESHSQSLSGSRKSRKSTSHTKRP